MSWNATPSRSSTPGSRRLDQEQAVLLVIDFQETILGRCLDRERVERNAVKLIRSFRELDLPVLVTEQYPKGLGPTTPAIVDAAGEIEPVPKTCFSCLGEPALERRLEETGRSQVILCGIETHICVYQTARDLAGSGRTVHVAGDAVTSRGEIDREVALRRMAEEGAVITSTELVIYDLLKDAAAAEFKRLLPLLREGASAS